MSDTDSLLPCPFCGSNPQVYSEEKHDGCKMFEVLCDNPDCYGSTAIGEKDNVVKSWNNRPIEDALRAELQQAREALQKVVDIFEIWEMEGTPAEGQYELCQIARAALATEKQG